MRGRLSECLSRVRGWLFKRRDAADLDQEIDTHVSLLAEQFEGRGMTRQEAVRQAKLTFGGLAQFKEEQHALRGLPWLDALVQDARYGLRVFQREPGFTAAAIVTLAIGIGANSAVFSLMNGYLRPLPVPAAADVVAIGGEVRGDETSLRYTLSYQGLADLRERELPFSDILAYAPWIGGLRAPGQVTSSLFSAVTGNFFSGLRLEPALGRFFGPSEGERPGSPRLVVLGYACWVRHFGSDPHVINTMVRIDGRSATVIGVVPKSFLGPYAGTEMDGYITIDMLASSDPSPAENLYTSRTDRIFTVFGRLKPGVTIERAQQALDVATLEIERAHPVTERNRTLRVFPERLARPFPQRTLAAVIPAVTIAVLALAALVLGLACVNVSNLVFVRALGRQREMAVRAAIGASRGRLVRQSMTESLLLAMAGGGAGVLVGMLAQRLFASGIDLGTDFPLAVDFGFDWRVFGYTLAAVTCSAVVVGLWPALRASRTDARTMLHDGGGGHAGSTSRFRGRQLLVMGQVAGALLLLALAGLFVRHLVEAKQFDLGFDTTHVLNARLDPRQVGYDDSRTNTFYRDLERRVHAWPNVESVSLASHVPLGYFRSDDLVFVEGRATTADSAPSIGFNRVSPDYFKTMHIPLLEGRVFRETDTGPNARVAIVNGSMAHRYWPNQTAIGKRFRLGQLDGPFWEVVGVARDSKYVLIFEDPQPYFYIPIDQSAPSMRVVQLRTATPESFASRLQREVRSLDPDMPIADLKTMQASLSGAMGLLVYRLAAYQACALGLIGLVLAIVGVYGVTSFSASQRTREIGIRIALGAHPARVVRLILRQGASLVGVGALVGTAGATLVTRVIARLSTMPHASNVPTVIGAAVGLTVLAMWACYVPARRAMRVDPMVALRHE
jgi:predicted permease